MAVKRKFTEKDIDQDLELFFKHQIDDAILKLSFIGEEFINNAKLNGNYKDRTGNLRSSIGYVVAVDGEVKKYKFEGTSEGRQNSIDTADELLQENNSGLVLIGFAGMEYGLAVESRGYDVISSSIPVAADILKDLMK
jgi:hypothetical protein